MKLVNLIDIEQSRTTAEAFISENNLDAISELKFIGLEEEVSNIGLITLYLIPIDFIMKMPTMPIKK